MKKIKKRGNHDTLIVIIYVVKSFTLDPDLPLRGFEYSLIRVELWDEAFFLSFYRNSNVRCMHADRRGWPS